MNSSNKKPFWKNTLTYFAMTYQSPYHPTTTTTPSSGPFYPQSPEPTGTDDAISVYPSGAKRSTLDARYDLLTPIGIRRVAEAAAEGSVKYGDYNCERGLTVLTYLNHALAHIFRYLAGDRTEDHLAHAAWNLLFACHSEEVNVDLNKGTLREPGCKPPKKT
jgi:hypothetical protein